ncbi:MAG: chloride channel protein [Actinomycetia bacterium]|nr:chloride channel protein [Actinomycetes bacterium]
MKRFQRSALTERLAQLVPEAVNSKLLAASVAVGILVGLSVGFVEYLALEVVLHAVLDWPFEAQVVAPLVGLILSYLLLRTIGQGCSPATSEEYITQFHSRNQSFKFREVPARISAGIATIGLGGAVGLEGPSIYLGSAIGHSVHRRLERHLGRGAAQQLLTAGAAAGVAAVFQAPATGVVFALESPYRDDVAHRALLPTLIASAASFLTFVNLPFVSSGSVLRFAVDETVGKGELIGAVALGVGAGLGGRTFAWFIRQAKLVSKRISPLVLIIVGGVALGGLAAASREVFGEPLTLGPGVTVFEWLSGKPSLSLIVALFFFRAVATLTTVGAGGVGGLFIPLAVQGVLLGHIVGDALDRLGLGAEEASEARLWPILGLAAFLAAGYRTPIAAVMFVAESTRGQAVVPALIAAAVSQLVAGSSSVSSAQRVERLGGLESRLALPIGSVMETNVMTVPPDATISEFVWLHALGQRQPVVPVVDGNDYLGLCSVHDAARIDRNHWDELSVIEIIDAEAPVGRPSWSIRDAVASMGANDSELLAIVDEQTGFIGLVRDSEIVKLDEILVETESTKANE